MDPNWREPPAGRVSDSAAKGPDGMNQYQSNQMMAQAATFSPIGTAGLSSSSSHTREQQFSHQYMHQLQQQQLQNQLLNFWTNQYQEIDQTTDFKNHSLPLARIKKIMKADGDVKMISADAPVIFARACEMFILELTLRSWINTEENRRRTLQKNDIATAITRTDMFDFLADIVPKDDLKDEVLAGVARGSSASAGGLAENVPYYYMPQQIVAGSPYGASKVVIGTPVADEAQYKQQTHPFAAQMWPHEPQNSQPDSDS